MSVDLDKNFSVLRDKILKINKDYKELSKEYEDLQKKYDLLKGKYEEEQRENPDHNRLMKNHINKLIKEIDACIAYLRNTGM